MYHTPGETDDHLTIYWRDKGVAFPGDNYYAAFPNLYAIRGTPNRDVMQWVGSIDLVRSLKPHHLVPSHTEPISGQDKVEEILMMYRDAVQLVHDQTVRFMNKGMHPDDIVNMVSLPKHMIDLPYLQPLYGTVPWSVKGVFDTYMGWFSGDVAELASVSPTEKAEKMIELAGGRKDIMQKAEKAYNKGQHEWALELVSYVFKVDREYEKARALRLKCLKALSAKETSNNGRYYYLALALEDHDLVDVKMNPKLMIQRMPLDMLFELLPVRVKAEECSTVNTKAVFQFTDTEEAYTLHLRNGIMDVSKGIPEKWDLKLVTTSVIWREILAKERSPLNSYTSGDIAIEGGALSFRSFMGCLEQEQ